MRGRVIGTVLVCGGAAAVGVFGARYATVEAAPAPVAGVVAAAAPVQVAENAAGAPAAGTEAQGVPLGATGATAEKKDAAGAQGAPLGGTGAADEGIMTPSGAPSRVLSQSALDMVKEIDGSPADPLAFEKTQDGRFWKITFAALGSFRYEVPDPDVIRKSATPDKTPTDQIPAKLRGMDAQEVLLVGFMVPIEITREGKVKSFAITQNQQFCCFGVPPAMNEWVMVTMEEGKLADYIMDLPVAAYGKLAVSEEIDDGYVLSLYRMTSSEVITAPELLKRTKKKPS